MRLLLLAGVTGLAIAAALLGIGLHQADSASAPVTDTEQRAALGPEGMTVNKHQARTPSAHQDGNRAAAVYLNQNVIDGVTPTICAADAAQTVAQSRQPAAPGPTSAPPPQPGYPSADLRFSI